MRYIKYDSVFRIFYFTQKIWFYGTLKNEFFLMKYKSTIYHFKWYTLKNKLYHYNECNSIGLENQNYYLIMQFDVFIVLSNFWVNKCVITCVSYIMKIDYVSYLIK